MMEMDIHAGTTIGELVDAWLMQLRVSARLENTTINEYERVLRKLVLPELGTVRLGELTTNRVNAVLAELGTRSVNRQRKAKVVTGAMLDLAVQCGALSSNPARGSISVSRPQTQTKTLTPSDLETARQALRAWVSKKRSGPKATADMADIIDLMLGTGARIGEVLALRWSDVDLDGQRVQIRATIKTETSVGTYRKPLASARSIELPEFAVAMLRRRRCTAREGHIDAVFPTRNGTWQQVNNVERRWRQIRTDAGLDWVTPDLFRHHVARKA
jgi:integrase